MHLLRKVKIQNFRSCKSLAVTLDKITPLVGCNNAGKSTIIKAICWLLAPSGMICADDFCGNDLSKPIEVCGEIHGITEELLEKLAVKHRTKIAPYINEEGVLHIKRVQDKVGSAKTDRPLFVLTPDKDFADEDAWVKNPTGIDGAISALFPTPIHIEAMQDASQDAAKNTSNSTLGKLLKEILGNVAEAHGQRIKNAVAELSSILAADGNDRAPELSNIDESTNRALGNFFPGIEIRTEVPAPTLSTLFKGGTLKVRDPYRGDTWHDFDSMGHGAQRTIQMSLIQCMAEKSLQQDTPTCRLLLIDEPELYLHPQAIEQVRSALSKLSTAGYQVVFSTHSPLLIGERLVPNTLLVRKSDSGTSVLPTMAGAVQEVIENNQAQARLLFALSNSSQLLFCDKALLVEGKTEARLLPYLYEKEVGRSLGLDKIALISLDGCDSTQKAIEVLDVMGIPFKAVVDIDAVIRRGQEYGICEEGDENLQIIKDYFASRKEADGICLDGEGLPKKGNGYTAAQLYADLANSEDGKTSVQALHEAAKEKSRLWAWPSGDIEQVVSTSGKKERHMVQFIEQAEREGLEELLAKPDELKKALLWIGS